MPPLSPRQTAAPSWIIVGVLLLFTFINLLCYFDRGALSASFTSMSASSLNLNEFQNGSLSTIFIVGFIISAPVFGKAVTRISPIYAMTFGMLIWAFATISTGLATSYITLAIYRLATGIGEASFVCIAAPIIDIIAPTDRRSTWLSYFYLAIPLGFASGIAAQGAIVQYGFLPSSDNWRIIFVAEGIIVIPFIVATLFIPDHVVKLDQDEDHTSVISDVAIIFSNPVFRWTVLGYAMQTFVVGGYSAFGDTFLEDAAGVPAAKASLMFGVITFAAGLGGTYLGGSLLDRHSQSLFRRNDHQSICEPSLSSNIAETPLLNNDFRIFNQKLFLQNAVNTVASLRVITVAAWIVLPCFALSFISLDLYTFISGAFLSEFCVFTCLAPCNSAVMWSQKSSRLRPLAMAISAIIIHLLGDAISPIIIGALVDYTHNWLLSLRLLAAWLIASLLAWMRALKLSNLELQKAMLESNSV